MADVAYFLTSQDPKVTMHNAKNMLKRTALALGMAQVLACHATSPTPQVGPNHGNPPVVEKYASKHRVRSGIALGGIGAGYVELRKDGQFYNWSIFNNEPLGTGPAFGLKTFPNSGDAESLQFFIVRYQIEGEAPRLKLLQLNDTVWEGAMQGISYYYPQMTAVENIEYAGRFPFVNMKFTDPEMPFDVYMEAFSPFIPHDVKNSAIPGTYFNFKIIGTSNRKVDVTLIATQRNLVGYDTIDKYFTTDVQTSDEAVLVTQGAVLEETLPTAGQMTLASFSGDTTYHVGWEHKHPYYERLLFEKDLRNEDDTHIRNKAYPAGNSRPARKFAKMQKENKDQRSFSSLAVSRTLDPKDATALTFEHTFAMSWFFPNAYGAIPKQRGADAPKPDKYARDFTDNHDWDLQRTKNQGHYYENYFNSAADVATYLWKNQVDLTERTRGFVDNYYRSTAPQFLLDQVNSNLNTFVSSSTLTKAGRFAIREGMSQERSWGPNATIDVALYGSSAVINLFPELQLSSMRAHKAVQKPTGEINHGLAHDLDYTKNGTWGVYHRIDMPGNYIQMVLRDYFHTGDQDFLREMWPSLKKAVQYVLEERDVDQDQMPDMTGIMCSYDNFPMYGLSSYIQSQWLAALKGMIEAADVIGDMDAKSASKPSLIKGPHLWTLTFGMVSTTSSPRTIRDSQKTLKAHLTKTTAS